MKKKTKKLVLAKETVRTLVVTDLAVPQGGSPLSGGFTICGCGASGAMQCFHTQQTSCTC